MLSTIIVQATQQKNCLWPRSSVYLQFSFCSWFPNISWVDIWMMPLWHHWAIWNMGALKWTHGIIMGSKYQSVQISPSSMSNHLSWLQDFKKCFSFLNATHGSRVMELQRSKVNFGFVQGRKNKVIPIFFNKVSNCSSLQEDSEK